MKVEDRRSSAVTLISHGERCEAASCATFNCLFKHERMCCKRILMSRMHVLRTPTECGLGLPWISKFWANHKQLLFCNPKRLAPGPRYRPWCVMARRHPWPIGQCFVTCGVFPRQSNMPREHPPPLQLETWENGDFSPIMIIIFQRHNYPKAG